MAERVIRVPNLPMGVIIDENGRATDDFLTFLQALTQSLQQNYGPEGLVMPTQTEGMSAGVDDFVTQIQNNQNEKGQYTCQLGTMLYVINDVNDYTMDKVQVAVRNSNDYPESAPLFKTFTVT